MTIHFRHYTTQAGITEDYFKVRNFFVELGYAEFTFARWDWMTTHTYLNKDAVSRIGLWEEQGRVVGVATFDGDLGCAYCLALPGYETLKRDMLQHCEKHLTVDGVTEIIIGDSDCHFQQIAAELGYTATPSREADAIFYLDQTDTAYTLPEGYTLTTMAERYDLYQYGQVLWKGFNHEADGEGLFQMTAEKERAFEAEMIRPNVDLSLKVAVVSPEGDFVSYCGMWYDPAVGYGVIEPVATDPDHRRKGLGKAAVLEGIRRVGALGAKTALVGSSQQFYYSIGMRPYATASIWKKQLK